MFLWIATPLAALYLGYWLTDLRRQQKKLPCLTQRVETLGCPTTTEEFERITAVPSETNAIGIYRELFAEIDNLKKHAPTSHERIQGLSLRTDRLDNDYREASRSSARLLCLLEEAARFPHFRIARFSDPSIDADQVGPGMRFLSKLLFLEVSLAVEDGDIQRVREGIFAFRRLGEHALFDATRLAWLIRISICSMYLNMIGTLLKQADSAEALTWIRELISDLPAASPLQLHIHGDVGLTFAEHSQNRGKPLSNLGYASFTSLLGYFSTERAWDAYLAGALEGQLYALERWPDESEWRTVERLTRPTWFEGKWWIAPSLAIPSPAALRRQGIGHALGSYRARIHLIHLGLALKDHRQTTGRFPATLEELGLSHPNLPSPVQYWPKNDGFVLRCGMIEF